MSHDISIFAALLVGLLGSVHCVGMCGGIIGALTMGLPHRGLAALPQHLAYNGGRLTSYVIAGALLGGLGALVVDLAAIHRAQKIFELLAGFFMIALGLYLGGWWSGLARLESAGGILWRRLEPLGRRWLPVRGLVQAYGLGVVWGWLPCGLVYSMLSWSIASGGADQGGSLMLAFGLGTLPSMLATGLLADTLARWTRHPGVRRIAGLLVLALGIWALLSVVGIVEWRPVPGRAHGHLSG